MPTFTLASVTEALAILMNTPLVPPEPSKAPSDVPLTEMPLSSRESKDGRRHSNSSSVSSNSHRSTTPESHDGNWSSVGLSNALLPFSPLSVSSTKKLPPLPANAGRPSRVRFADDVDTEL